MQRVGPDGPDVEFARGTAGEVIAAATGLELLSAVRAATRDAVVGGLAAAVHGGDQGPVAAVAVGGTGVVLELRSLSADRWALTGRPVAVPADCCALGRLRRGVDGLVAHSLRSPLVRAQGAVTLAQRAWSRDRHDQLDHELRRLETVTAEALARADGQADAIRRLAADGGVPAADGQAAGAPGLVSVADADTLAATLAETLAATRADTPAPAAAGPQAPSDAHDHVGVDGPLVAVVVVPQLEAVPVVALQRLVAHLRAMPTVARVHPLLPGIAPTWPVDVPVDDGAAPLRLDGDAEADLASARAWVEAAGDEPVTALAELVTLRRSGVRVVLLPARRSVADGSGSEGERACGWAGLSLPAARSARVARVTAGWPVLLDGGVEAVVFGSGSTAGGPPGAEPAAAVDG